MANATNYKLGSPIAVRYQAPNAVTGLTPIMEIYLPSGQKDSSFLDVEMDEIGVTGRYVGIFTPDAAGEWLVMTNDGTGKGKAIYAYSVGDYNLQAVGDAIVNLDGDVVAVAAQVTNLDGDVVAVAAQVTNLQADMDALEVASPPMMC